MMNGERPTYENLFTLLVGLDFRSVPAGADSSAAPKVFIHDPTNTILLFRDAPDEPLTPADLLSTEVHLHAKGIVVQSLETLLAEKATAL